MKRLKAAKSRKPIPGVACPASKLNQTKKANNPVLPSIPPSPPQPTINFTTLSSLLLLQNETEDSGHLDSTRGLTGLRNLGNTCYMNAALQSLSNCPQLSLYFMAIGKLLSTSQKHSMSSSYLKLVGDLWSPKRFSCVAPSSVHSTLRMINGSFRSYQQQDTQEFLRCFMDRLHEELKFAVPVDDPHSLPQFQEAGDASVSS
uniref:ubiquitinyl hydrolase 1 n=1 Tax=Phallusia mammillata TaxID=59560 RepID=A0A6F9DXG0_9ASCI|nr:ubiquitin carboxyl-terminal hydrolase 33-like [Phallusia mammillata]